MEEASRQGDEGLSSTQAPASFLMMHVGLKVTLEHSLFGHVYLTEQLYTVPMKWPFYPLVLTSSPLWQPDNPTQKAFLSVR